MKTQNLYICYIGKAPVLWLIGAIVPAVFNFSGTLLLAFFGRQVTLYIEMKVAIPRLVQFLGMALSLLLLNSVLHNLGKYCRKIFVNRIDSYLRADSFEKILFSADPHMNATRGGLLVDYNLNIQNFTKTLSDDIYGLINPMVAGVGTVAALWITSAYLGLLSWIAVLLVLYSNTRYIRKYKQIEQDRINAYERFNCGLRSVVKNRLSIKSLNLNDRAEAYIDQYASGLCQYGEERANLTFKKAITMDWIVYAVATLILPVACLLTVFGTLSIPSVIFVTQLCGNLIWNTKSFGVTLIELYNHAISKKYLQILLDAPVEDNAAERNASYDFAGPHSIRFKNFQIQYDREIIHQFDYEFRSGGIYALIGESGSGKSSILKSVLGLNSYSGSILYNGCDIKNLKNDVSLFAYMPENNMLLPDESIRNNILYGNTKIHSLDSELMEKASLQELEDIVIKPDSTCDQLSDGQKQRVCFARALIKNAPILLLDEPTSFLDAQNEHNILRTLRMLADKGYLIILTTHRETVIQAVDHIILIQDSKNIRYEVSKEDAICYLKTINDRNF